MVDTIGGKHFGRCKEVGRFSERSSLIEVLLYYYQKRKLTSTKATTVSKLFMSLWLGTAAFFAHFKSSLK